jgi:hypothetical protein
MIVFIRKPLELRPLFQAKERGKGAKQGKKLGQE